MGQSASGIRGLAPTFRCNKKSKAAYCELGEEVLSLALAGKSGTRTEYPQPGMTARIEK